MKIVFIAGAFRGPSPWHVRCNVHRAESLGLKVAEAGFMPLIPHANTAHFDGLLTDEFWLEGTRELLRRCDGVVLVDGWRGSEGTVAEVALASALGIPVWESVDDIDL